MQDIKTGELVRLDYSAMEMPSDQVEERLQRAKDRAIPDRSRQGIVLSVNQKITINEFEFTIKSFSKRQVTCHGNTDQAKIKIGQLVDIFHGNFKVKSFGRSMVILEGIPGTSARQDYIAKWKKIKARNNLYKLNKSKKSKRS